VPTLLACPFCRELYTPSEGDRCPHCGLILVDLEGLPPSLDAQREAALAGLVDPPELERQTFWYLGRGRGPLALLALLGFLLFLCPWAHLTRPDQVTLSGLDLAKTGAPWLFGGAIGWFLLLPLVWSRRSVVELRGIRVIASALSALTTIEAGLLLARPPLESSYYSSGLRYGWGLYASLLVSLLALWLSARLGGELADLRDLPGTPGQGAPDDAPPSAGLH